MPPSRIANESRTDDAGLLLGGDASEHDHVVDQFRQLCVLEGVQLWPGQQAVTVEHAQFGGDGLGRAGVVPGDHDDLHPGLLQLCHGFGRCGPDGVRQSDHAGENEIADAGLVEIAPVGGGAFGDGEDPKPLSRQTIHFVHNRLTGGVIHAETAAPLADIRVLDLSKILAGPYVSQALSDMSAEVVKVEQPNGGDPTRQWGPTFNGPDAAYNLAINRNKQSVTLDLTTEDSQQVVDRLLQRSDVVIDNFRPRNSLARLFHGPQLVALHISAYGETGPLRDEPRPTARSRRPPR